jgi:hypothetical protein
MNMASGYFNSNRTSSNSSQLGHGPHEHSNVVESRKIPFGHPQYIPDSQKNASPTEKTRNAPDGTQKILTEGVSNRSEAAAEQSNTLMWKLSEIKRLSRPYVQPQLVDDALSRLLLLVMNDNRMESLIDDILEKLRNNTSPLAEAFLRYPEFMDSNLKKTAKEKPLYSHHVEHLPEGVVTKLTQIELLLEPHYPPNYVWEVIEDLMRKFTTTGEDSVLDAALADYQMKYQKRG